MHARIQAALEAQRFFKVICGASYRNPDFISLWSEIFTLAGAHVIDIGAEPELVHAVRQGIERAQRREPAVATPLIMISVGVNHDVHFLRVDRDVARCDGVGFCANACPHGVFVGDTMRLQNCLGCDHCVKACPEDALYLVPREQPHTVLEQVRACFEAGATAIEIHTGNGLREPIYEVSRAILAQEKRLELLAYSIGAHEQSLEQLVQLAEDLSAFHPEPFVIQGDGKPISGRKGWRSTMPALVLAQALLERRLPAYIQVSGGVNNLTREIACRENIPVHGVAMGSFARKHVRLEPDTVVTSESFAAACARARELVQSADRAVVQHKQRTQGGSKISMKRESAWK